MFNRKFFLSLALILAGISLLGAAYATRWDQNWGPGTIRIEDQPKYEVLRMHTIGFEQALGLAEREAGGKAQGIQGQIIRARGLFPCSRAHPGARGLDGGIESGGP
jgi:hypothetical protein